VVSIQVSTQRTQRKKVDTLLSLRFGACVVCVSCVSCIRSVVVYFLAFIAFVAYLLAHFSGVTCVEIERGGVALHALRALPALPAFDVRNMSLQPSAGAPVTGEVTAGRKNVLDEFGRGLRDAAAKYQRQQSDERQQHASSGTSLAVAYLGFCKGVHGEREREPIAGVSGRSPQRGPGAEPLVRGPRPPEAETLLAFGRSMEVANLPTFIKFGKAENHRYICCLAKREHPP